MPPTSEFLTDEEVHRLPPMLFGKIRWAKGLGAPVGDLCSGFTITVEERTASKFRVGPKGREIIPGTGIWKDVSKSVRCGVLPDEGDKHVLQFIIDNVHLNEFPDGTYRVAVALTGNWSHTGVPIVLGYRRIEPPAFYRTLTKDRHLVSVDFEVVQEPLRFFIG